MAIVRVYAHEGLRQLRRMIQTQKATDSVMVLIQPYRWVQALDLAGGAAVALAPDNTSNVTLIRIEVPPGITMGYEINPTGRSVTAFDLSAVP
jgi:hypothetical protein